MIWNRKKKIVDSKDAMAPKTVFIISSIDVGDLVAYLSATLKALGSSVSVYDDTHAAYAQKYLSTFYNTGEKTWEYRGINIHSGIGNANKDESMKIVLTDRFLDIMQKDDPVYIMTDMDIASLGATCTILDSVIEKEVEVELVFFNYEDCKIDSKVANLLYSQFSSEYITDDRSVYFDSINHARKIENQYNDHISFKGISRDYKDLLKSILSKLTELPYHKLDLAIKKAEKGT